MIENLISFLFEIDRFSAAAADAGIAASTIRSFCHRTGLHQFIIDMMRRVLQIAIVCMQFVIVVVDELFVGGGRHNVVIVIDFFHTFYANG